jgi:hypothetical protein
MAKNRNCTAMNSASRYPMRTKPKNNQVFMYMNLAIGLAVDLGLDREHPTMSNFNAFSTKGSDRGWSSHQTGQESLPCMLSYLFCVSVQEQSKSESILTFPACQWNFKNRKTCSITTWWVVMGNHYFQMKTAVTSVQITLLHLSSLASHGKNR